MRIMKSGIVSLAALLAAGIMQPLPAAAKTQIKVIVAHFSDKTLPTYQAAAEKFMEKNPDIEVILEDVSWDNLQQRIATDVAAGTTADITTIANRWVTDFVVSGIAEPLNDYMSPEFRDSFVQSVLDSVTVDGEVYITPTNGGASRALYYNKDIFERAGIDGPPESWDDVIDAARKIKALDDGTYGYAIQGKEIETDTNWYFPFMSYGGNIVENGKSGINTDAGRRAVQIYKGMIDEGLSQPSPTASNRQDIEALFKQGRVGMVISGSWLHKQIQSDLPDLNYGVVEQPVGTHDVPWGGGDGFIIFQASKNKEAAWKFLEEAVFDPETVHNYISSEGMGPVTKAELEAVIAENDPFRNVFVAQTPFARFAPSMPRWEQVVSTMVGTLQQIYLGEVDADTGLAAAEKKINELIFE